MRIRAIICRILSLLTFAQLSAVAGQSQNLKELYAGKKYFELRDALQNHPDDRSTELLFYRGAVGNKFNNPQLSITHLKNYLRRAKESEDTDLLIECYEMLADNYLKTYQYRKAAEVYTSMLAKFGHKLDAKKKAEFENAVKLWGALRQAPRQTVVFKGNSVIKKDEKGHIPLEINNQSVAFIFDTGANLSVMTSALAKKLALEVIDAEIEVTAIAGNKVKAKLAVARETKFGHATIHDAVFLIFDDKDLYISEADLQINGLIGFPMIAALREITFVGDSEVFVPATSAKHGQQNMCLDGLTPLIAGTYRGKRLTFAFDTGASKSFLYPSFYKEYEDEIKAEYDPHTERVRGAGGYKKIKGYLAKNVVMQFSGHDARFAQIPILAEQTNDKSRHFYGNLGQDLITQFERMTLNFEAMSIVFE